MTDPQAELALRESNNLTVLIEKYEADFAAVVPTHVNPAAFVGMAAARVRSNPTLRTAARANPGSLILALRECAAMGHMPVRGTWSPVPFKGRKKVNERWVDEWNIQGVEEWRGTVARMLRAGMVFAVVCEVVRKNDDFDWRPGMVTPVHDYDFDMSPQERGPLRGVYAYARLRNGFTSTCVVLNAHAVARYRSLSKAVSSFWGPEWPEEGPNTEAMWRKTGVHRLEPFVATSSAYLQEMARAEAAAMDAQRFDGVPEAAVTPLHPDHEPVNDGSAPIDAEVVPDGPDWSDVQTAKPGAGTQ